MMKFLTTLIVLQFFAVLTRSDGFDGSPLGEYRLCGHGPPATGSGDSATTKRCTSWTGDFCPDANLTAPDGLRPGAPQDDIMTAGLANCEAGFVERLLCQAPPQDPCGENCHYRVCYGERGSTGAGVSGSMLVETRDGPARVDSLKVGDEVRGEGGYGRKKQWCKVIGLVRQSEGDLYNNFTSQHLILESKKRVVSNALYRDPNHPEGPKIVAGSIERPYELLTECELVSNSHGIQFSPLATTFCGKTRTSWNTYYVLYQAIADIIEKTGLFWLDLSNYKDCPVDANGASTCTFASWRTALPPICTMLLTCARVKSDASCAVLDKLAATFVKEHILENHAATFNSAYANEQTLGADLKAMDVPDDSERPWWQIDWSFFEDEDVNSDQDLDWEDPWVWVSIATGMVVIFGAIFCIWAECQRTGDASERTGLMEDYHSSESKELSSTGETQEVSTHEQAV